MHVIFYLNIIKTSRYKNKLWQAIKSRHCSTMWNRRDHGTEELPTILKDSLYPKKVMCIWWNWKGLLYYEFLLENQTINSNKYCSQLDQLKVALDEKSQQKMCHLPSGHHKVSLMTRQKFTARLVFWFNCHIQIL